MKASRLADLLGGTLVGADAEIDGFATDSREAGSGKAFLAIRGANVDGHDFVEWADASVAVVERPVAGPYILVDSLVPALARLGGSLRETFAGPVVGITGSAGKTTTKEMVAAALSPLGPVLKTSGNRNTEFTSPLLWTELRPEHRAVVVEMAMRGFGQIAHLADFTRPTVGLITNIGWSHLEQVGDRDGVARAKGELFDALGPEGLCVWWNEDDYASWIRELAEARPKATFGTSEEADSRVVDYRMTSWQEAEMDGVIDGQRWTARLPALGRHIALNAAAAVLVAHRCGVSVGDASDALIRADLPPMRMEVRERNGVTILLDAYNAAPNSMLAAIETLADAPVQGERYAVLGEMRELGDFTVQAHQEVARKLRESGVRDAVFLGTTASCYQDAFGGGTVAEDIAQVQSFLHERKPGDAVLIKGSRALALERALDA